MKTEDRPFSPKEIAKETKIKPPSVRSAVARLLKDGQIQRVYYGAYRITPALGVGRRKTPKLQNLQFVAEGVKLGASNRLLKARGFVYGRGVGWVWSRELDPVGSDEGFRLAVQLGRKRGKVNWTVKAPLGLDFYGFRLCCWMVADVLSSIGVVFEDFDEFFIARNVEYLFDHFGVSLEGVKAFTVRDVDGLLEKYYNKIYGVRHEVRDSRPTKLENVVALVSGGVPVNQVISGVGLVHEDIKGLTAAMKGQSRTNLDKDKMVGALVNANLKLIDRIDALIRTLNKS